MHIIITIISAGLVAGWLWLASASTTASPNYNDFVFILVTSSFHLECQEKGQMAPSGGKQRQSESGK